jgi:hypothetical protein
MRTVEIVFVLLAGALAVRHLTRMIRDWGCLKGDRLVTCPVTGHPAAVRIDVLDAAFKTRNSGNPKVRIANCSLWMAGGACSQGCVWEAVASESAVRSVVAQWYANKKCVYCGKPITPESLGHRSALRGPQGATREWSEVPPARLLDSLRIDSPVCWNCHVAETFRRTRPELVTDRPWPKNQVRRTG